MHDIWIYRNDILYFFRIFHVFWIHLICIYILYYSISYCVHISRNDYTYIYIHMYNSISTYMIHICVMCIFKVWVLNLFSDVEGLRSGGRWHLSWPRCSFEPSLAGEPSHPWGAMDMSHISCVETFESWSAFYATSNPCRDLCTCGVEAQRSQTDLRQFKRFFGLSLLFDFCLVVSCGIFRAWLSLRGLSTSSSRWWAKTSFFWPCCLKSDCRATFF